MFAFSVYGIKFTHDNARAALRTLCSALKTQGRQMSVFTPNFSILHKCKSSPSLCALINQADVILPDGAGVSLLCRMNGLPSVPRITGIDTGYFLLRYAAKNGLSVFFLGGKKGVARRAARKLKSEIPELNICGTHHGYFDKSQVSPENLAIVKKINRCRPDILFVCFGFPLQEQWICQNMSSLPYVKLCLGLGGSLDVWCGDVKRAPLAFRITNLEWLWRNARYFSFEKEK